ncbi:MAG: transcription antitermination factor NusB [Bacillota bacterium]|jgi:N utilization substance protein B
MSRRLAREVALRTLFQLDSGHVQLDQALDYALETVPLAPGFVPFARRLVDNALAQQETSDQIIREKAVDWNIDRLARVDRAILRLALGELMADKDTPAGVVINEAVELANRYSTEESGKFINGILGAVVRSGQNE